MPRTETAVVFRYSLIAILAFATPLFADDSEGKKHLLRYSLKPGQKLHFEVTHVAKTKTRIRGSEESSHVHTISRRHWDVESKENGVTRFAHFIDTVEMTQQQGDSEEVRWNSTSGEEAPVFFNKVSEQIGEKLSTITINDRGQEKNREDHGETSKASLGMGALTLAMPEEPLAIGDSWAVPREIKARTDDGMVKPIKIRELYTLEKVKSGIATLSVRSEPLTPMDDDAIKAQVIQQLSNGTIRFDIDAGHMLSKELTWDETVVGFQGANSMMEYRARMTERYLDDAPPITRTAKRPTEK